MPDNIDNIDNMMFDRSLRRFMKLRAENRAPSFLVTRMLEDVCDRVLDINRDFARVMLIGPRRLKGIWHRQIGARKAPVGIDVFDRHESAQKSATDGSYDLVISVLDLHALNNLPRAMTQIKRWLKPDGLLIAGILGGRTLTELRFAFYQAEEAMCRNATPRVIPFMTHTQAATLLQHSGYAMPVVDIDRVNVGYGSVATLIADIRDMGEGNCLYSRDRSAMPKGVNALLEQAYAEQALRADGKYVATFEILWLTGWSPDKSQPKALKPGSAKIGLAEGLRKVRDRKNDAPI